MVREMIVQTIHEDQTGLTTADEVSKPISHLTDQYQRNADEFVGVRWDCLEYSWKIRGKRYERLATTI